MKYKQKKMIKGILFILPYLIGFLIFYIIPAFWSFIYSFKKGAGGDKFVWLENYIKVFKGTAFRIAAFNTFRFIFIGVSLLMIISFAISIVLFKSFSGASMLRTVFLYPLVVPIAALVLIVQAFFAESGILNQLYLSMGLEVKNWLQSESAFSILIFLYIWKYCGYNIILFLAGLNAIPFEFFQVAELEGASRWKIIVKLIIPLLMPTFFFVFVISIVNSFKCFREAYLIGGNNPHKSIYMIQHFMNKNFQNLSYQRLSVASTFIFIFISLLIFVLFYFKNKQETVEMQKQ